MSLLERPGESHNSIPDIEAANVAAVFAINAIAERVGFGNIGEADFYPKAVADFEGYYLTQPPIPDHFDELQAGVVAAIRKAQGLH